MNKKCTCHFCNCNCIKLFYVNDMTRIFLARAQQCGQVPSTPCPADETSQFIAQAFLAGHQATIDAGGSHLGDDHWMDVCHAARADFVMRMGSNQ